MLCIMRASRFGVRYAQYWDGIVVAVSVGFEPFLGKPVSVLKAWLSERKMYHTIEQERLPMSVAPGVHLIITESHGKYMAYTAAPNLCGDLQYTTACAALSKGWDSVWRSITRKPQ